ncbi:MAG TPA: hypothetical protein PLB38_03520 [bacterium]|nr:hypothetical protein [bacterium]
MGIRVNSSTNKKTHLLLINTAINHYLGFALWEIKGKSFVLRACAWRKALYSQSEKFLQTLDAFLIKNGVAFGNVAAIVAVNGPGSFSAVRLGVVGANTIGLLHNIPVYSYKLTVEEIPDLTAWRRFLAQFEEKWNLPDDFRKSVFSPVLPLYGGDAPVTVKKKKS